MSFCTGNWQPARGHMSDIIFASRTSEKRYMKAMDMNADRWEDIANDRSIW